jgi:WD40 repeat protein
MKAFKLLLLICLFSSFSFSQESYPLETILQKGHSKYVTCADFHPSGKYIVTGGFDNSIILWNAKSGKEIRMFNRHTSAVWSVVFSKDGSQILSTSADQTTKLYDVITGNLIHSFSMPKDDIRQAYFSPDGNLIYLVNNRDGIFVHDRLSGDLIGEYSKNYASYYQRDVIDITGTKIVSTAGYKGSVVFDIKSGDTLLSLPFDKTYGMAFSPDGSKIALSSSKLFTKVFDAATGKEIIELRDTESDARCDGCNTKQVWSNSGKYLLTMSNKVDAILWEVTSGKIVKRFNSLRERPVNLKFSPDDSKVLISFDKEVFVYDLKSGRETMHVKNDQISYYEVNFSPDGNYIVLPGDENTAEVWDVRTGRVSKSLEGFINRKRDDGLRYSYANWTDAGILEYITKRKSFELSPDDKHIVIGGIDSTALMIELESGKVVREFNGHSKIVIAFDFSPDGKTLATAGGDRTIKIWDVATGKELETIRAHRNLIFDLEYSSNGRQIASASWDGTMGIWNLETGDYRIKDMNNKSPYKIGFSPNDLYVVTGDLGEEVNFWEIDAAESFRKLVGHTDITGDFDFSPDGKELVTASWDGKVKVWDVLTGMLIGRNAHHSGAVYAVAYDPKSRFIASAGADNSVVLWDSKTNKVIQTLYGHTNAVTDLAFTSDGSKLISTSVEGVIKVWDLNSFTERYSRIQISKTEWLSTTSLGYFDGSSKALGLVNYVSGLEVVPVSSLFDKYYSPGLMKRINNGESFNDTGENIGKLIGDSPIIAFHLSETSKRSIPVTHDSVYIWKKDVLNIGLHIDSQDQEIEEIRIYNNGKLIQVEEMEKNIVFRGGDKDIRDFEIALSHGKNEITALVVNEERTESEETKILVEYDGIAALTDLYILSIGINKYKNSSYNLDYAVNDSKSFTRAVEKGGDTLFNTVVEYSITNEGATKENIQSTIEEIKAKIGPEDVFVFYYAGHGVMSYEENEEDSDFFIVTYDVTNLYGETEMLKEKAISAKELMEYSVQVVAEKQLFILDACHSGGALNSFATRGSSREKALAQLARSTGTFFLTASQDAQYANEVGDLKHGLFTYALLEIIEGQVGGSGDQKVTVTEIKTYVEDRVPELTEEHRGSPQYPTSYSFGQDFPIVILK